MLLAITIVVSQDQDHRSPSSLKFESQIYFIMRNENQKDPSKRAHICDTGFTKEIQLKV